MAANHKLYKSYRLVIILLVWLYLATIPGLAFSTWNFGSVCMIATDASLGDPDQCVSGNFSWSSDVKSHLFAGYSYGGIVAVLFCGWAVDVLGAKVNLVAGSLLAFCATVLVPLGAEYGDWKAILVLRIALGVSAGPAWPAVARVAAIWFPKKEKSIAMGIASTGFAAGTFICNLVSGFLCCAYDWRAVFYFGAATVLVNLLLILAFFSSAPEDSRWISEAERRYILQRRPLDIRRMSDKQNSLGKTKSEKTPWLKMLTSLPVWAVIINGYGERTIQFFTLMFLPTYLNDALGVQTTQNGVLSALPELCQIAGRSLAGFAGDKLAIFKGKSTWNAKFYNSLSLLSVILLLVGQIFVKPGQSWLVTLYMCLQFFLGSFVIAGYFRSAASIAPRYSGTILGASTFGAFLAAVTLPHYVGALTRPVGTLENWRYVFCVIIAILAFAVLFFAVFGTTEVQSWAKTADDVEPPTSIKINVIHPTPDGLADASSVMRF